jgi:hypothetical protein
MRDDGRALECELDSLEIELGIVLILVSGPEKLSSASG